MISFVVCCGIQGDVTAQKQKIGVVRPAAEPAPKQAEEEEEDLFPGAAHLDRDRELQRALNKARKAAQKGQYEMAVIYWKKLLERMSLTLMSQKGETTKTSRHAYRKYSLARREIEQAIRNLPAKSFEMYQDKVDSDAGALYNDQLQGDPVFTLEKVINYYFLSSYGDDAALKLAYIYSDRGDFSKAVGLLERILNDYPNASVSRSSVLMLLSLSYAHLGNFERAKVVFSQAEKVTRSEKVLTRVDAVINHSQTNANQPPFTLGNWNMRLGNVTRRGVMVDPQFKWFSKPLTLLWEQSFGNTEEQTPRMKFTAKNRINLRKLNITSAAYNRLTLEQVRRDSAKWKKLGATPANQLLIVDNLLFFKADQRLVCCDTNTGEIKWMGRPNRLFNSSVDADVSYKFQSERDESPLHRLMKGQYDRYLFGDRIVHSMSITGDLLLNIEGKYSGDGGNVQYISSKRNSLRIYGRAWRGKTNWLAAYNVKTGKLKWHRSAMENLLEEKDWQVGFLSAPVPYENSLLVPVSKRGEVWLYSLSKTDGKLEWKVLLCEAPEGHVSLYSPVGLSVKGGNVYVATGAGLIFAIDAKRGIPHWSIRYQRTGGISETSPQSRRRTFAPTKVRGWNEDTVIPYRHMLVVIPSDYQMIFAVDRATGKILWESPQVPASGGLATYRCLGVVGEKLYLASSKIVRCYNMNGGRLEWEQKFSGSVGQGFLSKKYLYLPIQNDIVKYDRHTGKKLASRGVYTSVDEPLGNLYSNRDNLFVVSPRHLYSVMSMEDRLQKLAKKIQSGDPVACWERMKLRYRMGKLDDAIADLHTMIRLMAKYEKYNVISANQKLYDAISLMKLESVKPMLTFDLLLAANQRTQQASVQLPSSQIVHRERLVSAALTQVSKKITKPVSNQEHQKSIEKIIEVAPLCENFHVMLIAKSSLSQILRKEDIPLLIRTLQTKNAFQRLLATKALLSREGLKFQSTEKLISLMTTMLNDSHDDVKFSSAFFLIHQKQRNALGVFVQLLESKNASLRAYSVWVLRNVSGANKKYFAYRKPASQSVAIAAWKKWYTKNGETVKWDFTANSTVELGRTLVAYGTYKNVRIVDYDANKKEIWSIKTPYPGACIGLPNGHRLISPALFRTIDEYNANGTKIWTLSNLPGYVVSLQRLPNGNTFVVAGNKVLEYSHDKSVVWKSKKMVRAAFRLSNGNTLMMLYSGKKMIEVDPNEKIVWEIDTPFNSQAFQRLPNGNTLIATRNGKTIEEYTKDKRRVSRLKTTQQIVRFQRLSNGNTLISNNQGAYEYAPSGKVIWQKKFSYLRSAYRY